MYEDRNQGKEIIEKHVRLATDMTGAICEFTPEQQNEIVEIIYETVHKNRRIKIEEAEKQFCYLKETLIQLQSREMKGNQKN